MKPCEVFEKTISCLGLLSFVLVQEYKCGIWPECYMWFIHEMLILSAWYWICGKSAISRDVIIYQMYRFIMKLSCKRCTGNSAMLIETALSKYSCSCNNVANTMDSWNQAFSVCFLAFYTDVLVKVTSLTIETHKYKCWYVYVLSVKFSEYLNKCFILNN